MPSETKNLISINEYYGMYTLHEATTIPDFYLANSRNVSCQGIGGIFPFKQYSQFANQITDVGSITSSTTVYCSDPTLYQQQIPLRVRDDNSTATLEWYNKRNNTWEVLKTGYTTGKIMVWADFNNATDDRVYFCNGTDKFTYWFKAIGTVASNTSTVITMNEDAVSGNFPATGTVIVNGTEYAYTGVSGKTLTGLSGLPTFSADIGIALTVNETADAADRRFDIMIVADSRIWGTRKDSSRILYSKNADGSTWTSGTAPADPGFIDLPDGEGGFTGLASIREFVILFKKNLVYSYRLLYPSSSTRTEELRDLKRGNDVGAACPQGIMKVGDTVYYNTPTGGIKSISLSRITTDFDFNDDTEFIRPSIKKGDFSSSVMIWHEKERVLLSSYKKDSNSTANDSIVVIEYTMDTKQRTMKVLGTMDWAVNCFFHFENDLYFGSSVEQNCFKAFDGYERGPNIPYRPLFTTKRYRFDKNPLIQKDVPLIPVTGYIGAGTKLYFQLDFDYLGSRAHLESSFDSEEKQYVIEPVFNTIGAFELGTEPIGGTMDDINELNYFKIYFTIDPKYHPFDVQLTVYSDTAGARWKIETINFSIADANFNIDSHLKKQFS